jgi:hypothetical protein
MRERPARGRRRRQKLVCCPLIEADPAVDHHQPVAHLLKVGQRVGRHEHRAALPRHFPEEPPHVGDANRIESARRLVQQQHVGVAEERRGDAEPLLHARRIGSVAIGGSLGQSNLVEDGIDSPPIVPADTCDQLKVLPSGERPIEGGRLD